MWAKLLIITAIIGFTFAAWYLMNFIAERMDKVMSTITLILGGAT